MALNEGLETGESRAYNLNLYGSPNVPLKGMKVTSSQHSFEVELMREQIGE